MQAKLEVKIPAMYLRNYLKTGLLFDMESNTTSTFPDHAKLLGAERDISSDSILVFFERANIVDNDDKTKRCLVFKTYPFEGLTRIKKVKDEPPRINYLAAIWCDEGWRIGIHRGENIWTVDGRKFRDVQVYMPMPVLPEELFNAWGIEMKDEEK